MSDQEFVLHRYKDFVQLAEILALLHDLGKVNDRIKRTFPFRNHLKTLAKEMGIRKKYYPTQKDILIKDADKRFPSFANFCKAKWNIEGENEAKVIVDLPEDFFKTDQCDEELGFTALKHHFYTSKNKRWAFPTTLLQNIIAQADNIDSAEDRTSVSYFKHRDAQSDYLCNAFGQIVSSFKKSNKQERESFYQGWEELFSSYSGVELIQAVIKKRRDIFDLAEKHWRYAPAMSIYPDNDTSVWDHCYGTASITKAILNGILLQPERIKEFNHLVISKNWRHPRNRCYLMVFESDGLSAELHKIMTTGKEGFKHGDLEIRLYPLTDEKLYIGDFRGDSSGDKKYVIFDVQYTGKIDETATNKYRYTVNDVQNALKDQFPSYKKQIAQSFFTSIKGAGKRDTYLHLFKTSSSKDSEKYCLLDCLIGRPNVLAIQYPGRDYRTRVHRISDFIGRKDSFTVLRDQLVNKIEEGLALGNLIHEDVNGMYFMIPQLDSREQELISKKVNDLFNEYLDGDLLPRVEFQPAYLAGGGLNFGKAIVKLKKEYESNIKKKLPAYQLANLLTDPKWIRQWDDKKVKKEICHICGRRPIVSQFTGHAKEKACQWCLELRTSGIHQEKDETYDQAIFVDQIKDENNKLALLVGDYGLFDLWLSGNYIRTNLNPTTKENKDHDEVKKRPKRPSPSRLRALGVSMDQFFGTVRRKMMDSENLRGYGGTIKLQTRDVEKIPNGFYTIKLRASDLKDIIQSEKKSGEKLSENERMFIQQLLGGKQIEDLGIYIHQQNGKHCEGVITSKIPYNYLKVDSESGAKKYTEPYKVDWIRKVLEDTIQRSGELFPDGSRKALLLDEGTGKTEVLIDQRGYNMVREIYGLADEFMWLVPANRVIEIKKIFEETFTEHFGRAQGRISLNMGSVFFDHKYPLYLIFDAGKRMLKQFRECIGGKDEAQTSVQAMVHSAYSPLIGRGYRAKVLDTLPSKGNDDQQYVDIRIEFLDGLFKGKRYSYQYPKQVEIIEGDEKEDIWFTNVIGLDSEGDEHSWRVRPVIELQANDEILFIPNIFDFQLVNATEARLEISVDDGTDAEFRRRDNSICQKFSTRPFVLDDLRGYERAYTCLQEHNITKSALYHLQEQIIYFAKEMLLGENSDNDLFEEYAKVLIGNIGNWHRLKSQDIEFADQEVDQVKALLEKMLVDGSYLDFMELMMKHRVFDWQEGIIYKR